MTFKKFYFIYSKPIWEIWYEIRSNRNNDRSRVLSINVSAHLYVSFTREISRRSCGSFACIEITSERKKNYNKQYNEN